MIEYLEAIILGVIQGLTEFLPVSSSGHLEIAKYFFGENAVAEESLLMTVVLHFATALSTVIVFRKDILEIITGFFAKEGVVYRKFVGLILLSMVPAGIVGILAEDWITSLFTDNLLLVCSMLILTAILLYVADSVRETDKQVGPLAAVIIGISQAIAIIPGISRSGATISTALLLNIDREKAARFSFLMVVPLIFGKIILDVADGAFTDTNGDKIELILGFFAAFISGYFACTWMIAIVKRSNLKYFSFYCLIVALLGIIYYYATS